MTEPRARMCALLLGLLAAVSAGQSRRERVEWLKEHALPIASVDPADQDFTDLTPLKDIIGDARVVQLGEQSHGDGVVFLLKARLIQFLHQEMGFDVIAFESGLYDCRKAWELLQAGGDPLESVQAGVFGIWTGSAQVRPLIDYIGECARTDRPLELAGFDCQFTGKASADWLLPDLEQFIGGLDPPLFDEDEWRGITSTIGWLVSPRVKGDALDRDRRIASLERLAAGLGDERITAAHAAPEVAFWRQLAASMLGQAKQVLDELRNGRDQQMGENLVWLAQQCYPERKIIVWAATMHSCRNAQSIHYPGHRGLYDGKVTMGDVAAAALGDELFTIGFGAFEGSAGPWHMGSSDIGRASNSSIENLVVAAGFEHALVPLRDLPPGGEWLRATNSARPLGHAEMRADWTQVLDAIIVDRKMTPSTKALDPASSIRAPRALSREEADAARDLLASLAEAWAKIHTDIEKQSIWAEQSDFLTAYGKWRTVTGPDPEALAAAREDVTGWLANLPEADSQLRWRVQHLLAAISEQLDNPVAQAEHLDSALEAIVVREHRRPAEQGRFQHLVNARALLLWDRAGFEAAVAYAADLLATDARYRYFDPTPWEERLVTRNESERTPALHERIRAAYEARAAAFPARAAECRRFARKLR